MHAALSLASQCVLAFHGKVLKHSGEGTTQGDLVAGPYSAVCWHPQLRELDRVVSSLGGAARAVCIDLVAVGPPDIVLCDRR